GDHVAAYRYGPERELARIVTGHRRIVAVDHADGDPALHAIAVRIVDLDAEPGVAGRIVGSIDAQSGQRLVDLFQRSGEFDPVLAVVANVRARHIGDGGTTR